MYYITCARKSFRGWLTTMLCKNDAGWCCRWFGDWREKSRFFPRQRMTNVRTNVSNLLTRSCTHQPFFRRFLTCVLFFRLCHYDWRSKVACAFFYVIFILRVNSRTRKIHRRRKCRLLSTESQSACFPLKTFILSKNRRSRNLRRKPSIQREKNGANDTESINEPWAGTATVTRCTHLRTWQSDLIHLSRAPRHFDMSRYKFIKRNIQKCLALWKSRFRGKKYILL